MARAQLCQRVAQGDVVGLLLLQRLQRGVDGLDEIAEGLFEVVERREPTVGVEQEVAQRLVVLADPGADVGKCLLAVVFGADQALLLTGRAHLDGRWSGWNALTAFSKPRNQAKASRANGARIKCLWPTSGSGNNAMDALFETCAPPCMRSQNLHIRGSTCAHFARILASSSALERATMGKVSRRDHGLHASMTTRALRGSSLA